MNTRRLMAVRRFGLLLALLCIWCIPHLAGAAPLAQIPTGPLDAYNGTPDYYTTANWANSPPLAKFVDTLPGLTIANKNNLNQFLPVAVPDTTTYPGSDYYIIELREYSEKMHSDLNPTKLRGYVQVDAAGADVAPIHYLGPIIVSHRDRPVRLKFVNKLPTGVGGNLFIPVDTSVMGAGPGPITGESYTQNRADIHLHGGRTPWISDGTPHQWITPAGETTSYTKGVSLQNVPDMPDPGPGASTYYFTNQQSARLMFYHDHAFGITRLNVYAGEAAGYLITDQYEQDLITRGIVPADQIPLIIQDKTFVDATPTVHPVTGQTVPKVRLTDPLWNWGSAAPVGGVVPPVTGDLWMPHVYMPAQLPEGSNTGGVNPFGRWMYGPWFYPATAVTHGPVPNPYYDPNCSDPNPFIYATCQTPGQPTLIPGTPNVSMGMEAFQDSVVVNGTAFPSLTVDPRAYRFRVLNAAGDRFQNLSFYVADPAQISPDTRLLAAGKSNQTEVKMVPASAALAAANNWPALWPVDGRDGGVPDPGLCQPGGVNCPNLGPSFLQIGTEGGFLPNPVVINPQPITYITDPTAFWVGIVDQMGLALGPAERADVIVDFSAYAGKTLILYNDAPAAWPARVPGYDYFTGAPDMRDSGGYGTGGVFDPATGTYVGGTGPLVGYAPNTRTVMQVIVRPTLAGPANTYTQAALEAEFTSAAPVSPVNPAPVKTLFERAQEPIIVGQPAYSSAYPNSYFPPNFPWEGVTQMNDEFLKFVTLAGEQVKMPTEPKGIHDEMGASFDPEYGRMSGNLAMQLPNATTLNANLVLYGYSDLPTEYVSDSTSLNVQVLPNPATGIGSATDGTQIWKISHNGVDTHPIHFHIFDVQLINRVGWDGQIAMPNPNELGWKDTVKISPLMDTIVAVRPRAPALPFGIPNSLRPLNPAITIDSAMGFTTPTPGSDWPFFSNIDWLTGQAYVFAAGPPAFPYDNYKGVVTNVLHDFGWEYVWHCHILSHEEMDMMRPIVLKVETALPPPFTVTAAVNGGSVDLTWIDPTPVNYITLAGAAADPETYRNPANEIGFNVYRSTNGGASYDKLNAAALLANSTTYTDSSPVAGAIYQIEAFNAKGSTFSSAGNSLAVTVAANGGPFTSPGPITLSATISPAGASISQVAFYSGATQLGTDADAAAPYEFIWKDMPQGTYSVTARVTDNLGALAISAPITVTVGGSLVADFTVSGSAAAADIGFCETVTFTSTSTGATGFGWTINGVNYLTPTVNTTLPAGTYPVTLTVVDSATSATAQVTKNVTIVNHNPTAITGGAYIVTPGGSVTLNGSGTDTLDACNTTPLTYAWNVDNLGPNDFFTANPTLSYTVLNAVLGAGTHTIALQATDSNGGIGTATTTLTVSPVFPPAAITVPATSSTGNFTVSWAASPTPAVTYTLEESTTSGFAAGTTTVVASGLTVLSQAVSGKLAGTYYYRVKAALTPTLVSAWTSGGPCNVIFPVTVATLTASPVTSQVVGQPVQLTATGTGGSGTPEYQFMVRIGGVWTSQPWTTNPVWNWNTTGMPAGVNFLAVYVRNVGSTAPYEAWKTLNYTLAPVGTPIAGAATSISSTGFTANWSLATSATSYRLDVSTSSTFASFVTGYNNKNVGNVTSSVVTGLTPGTTYYYRVRASNAIGTSTNSNRITVITSTPVALATLTANPATQAVGQPVQLTATGTGGSGTPEYQFRVRIGGVWTAQPWTTNPVWNWDTTGMPIGTAFLAVYVRNVGSTAPYEAWKTLNYQLQ